SNPPRSTHSERHARLTRPFQWTSRGLACGDRERSHGLDLECIERSAQLQHDSHGSQSVAKTSVLNRMRAAAAARSMI
ncbi:MAG TPA: hypothetical protein VKE51_34030, partial [Vicinamibacterales bacterium]|nr:hypothetical protein [Vicinamibacterales bacterium]